MDKQEVLGRYIEVFFQTFILSLLASLVRLFFYKNETFWKTVWNFIGGILFGVMAGYLANTIEAIKDYDKVITAFAALLGKEIIESLIKYIPLFIKNALLFKFKKNDDSN